MVGQDPLSKVRAPTTVPGKASNDAAAAVAFKAEVDYLETEKNRIPSEEEIRLRLLSLEVKQLKHVVKARKRYANKIYRTVSWWLLGVAVFLVLQAFGLSKLSDKVMITVIGGTTVNILGILAIVANFLFPKGGLPLSQKQKKGKKKDVVATPTPRRRRGLLD